MPSTDEIYKRLIYQFSSTGADKLADDLDRIITGQDKLAKSSENTTRASLDLEKSFDGLERRFDSTIRAQQDYEKVQAKVNAAVAQHPELQERANNVLEKAREHFDKAGASAGGFNAILEKARTSLLGFAAQGGAVGAVLGSFGPWGVAAAAGVGLVTTALDYMKQGAEHAGDAATDLQKFAENTGLTVTQVRALNDAGTEVGVSSEKMAAGIEKFTLNLAEARKASGPLYDQLHEIDRQLAADISTSKNSAAAFDILTKAISSTSDAVTKAAIGNAAFGKGGASLVQAAGVIGEAGGLSALQKAPELTDEWFKSVAKLRNETKNLQEDLKLIEESLYATSTLERSKQMLEIQLKIAKTVKDIAAQQGGNAGPLNPAIVRESIAGKFDQFTGLSPGASAEPAASFTDRFDAMGKAAEAVAPKVDKIAEASARVAARVNEITASWGDVGKEVALSAQAMQNTLPVAQAWTEAGRMRAQQEATYNSLIDKGKTVQEATLLSSKQYELSQAAAQASAQKTVQSSQDNVDRIKAQGTEMEGVVASSIAYRDAIQAGASATQAAAISANVLEANLLQAAAAADKVAQAANDAQIAMIKALGGGDAAAFGRSSDNAAFGGPNQGAQFTSTSNLGTRLINYNTSTQSTSDMINAALAGGDVGTAINRLKGATAITGFGTSGSFADYGLPSKGTQDDIVNALTSLYDLKRAQPGADKAAITQDELATLFAQKDSPAALAAISSLANSLDNLTTSTDNLNRTNSELLSPYYTQDPRTSHIGFRSQGMATGGYVDVPGAASSNDNMMAMIPVAGGERIYVDPMSSKRGTGGGTVINISAPMTFTGPVNRDEVGRTVYQTLQNQSRQMAAAQR